MLTVANLKEELAIAEKTAQEYKQKMESEAEKAKQFKTAASEQIQQYKDDIDDKDAVIQQLNGKVEILQNNNKYIKKSYDSLLNKHKTMQNENFLIPKEKKNDKKDEE